MKKKQKETQDILSYHTQAAGCSDKARAKEMCIRDRVQSVEDSVQHDLGGSFLTDHQLIFKMPIDVYKRQLVFC